MKAKLTWDDNNEGEQGHRVYRSLTPMDSDALPAPLIELGPDVVEWEDPDVPDAPAVYYRVSAFAAGQEAVSDEVVLSDGDPHWDKVTSLLPFNGENGTSNTVTFDERGVSWTLIPAIFSQDDEDAFDGSGAYFSGSGAALQTSALIPEKDNWTLELRIKPEVGYAGRAVLAQNRRSSPNSANRLQVAFTSSGALQVLHNDGSSWMAVTCTFAPSSDGYVDMMVARDGDQLCIAANGSEIVRTPVRSGLSIAQEPFTIGVYYNETGNSFVGMVDQFRLTSGVVRFPDTYTPSSNPFPNFGPFSPKDISTELWLDASDASTITLTSGRVSTWSDKSGKNRHATQGTAGLRPTWDGADLALVFDGSRGLTAPGFNMAEGTFFFVSESYGDNGDRQTVSRRGGSNWTNLWRYHPPTLENGSPYTFMSASNSQVIVMPAGTDLPRELSVVAGVYDLSEGAAYVRFNGEEAGRAATAGNLKSSSALWGIGCATPDTGSANPYNFLYGSIREVLFVPNPVGVEVLQNIEGYLAWKWGLVDKLPEDHPYKTMAP